LKREREGCKDIDEDGGLQQYCRGTNGGIFMRRMDEVRI
jgi:hypothetical protein